MRPGKPLTSKSLALLTSLATIAMVVGTVSSGAAQDRLVVQSSECRPSVAGSNLQTVTIPELTKGLAGGRITSRGLVGAYLTRIRAYDGKLNSIRALNPQALRIAARLDAERSAGRIRGPLHGIPVLLKDNIGTLDMPTTAGSIALEGSIPLHAATITEKLEDAGAIILGKTNLSEFANWVDLSMPSGYSSLGGQVLNPYAFADTPSGSSSGSGVAGTMAFAAGTVGTETSGSILSPSGANSLVGIKPTTGLLSRYGILPLAPSFDTPGPMTRTVTDAAVMLGVMAGVDPKDPRTEESADATQTDYTKYLGTSRLEGARIGYNPDDGSALFDKALTVLEEQGATLVETDKLANTSLVGLTEIAEIPNEFKASLNTYLAEETPDTLRVRTLGDIIEYNEQHPDKVKYGQKLLIASNATPGVDNPATQAAATVTIESSKAAIDATLLADDLDAIVAPGSTYANVGAAAGYPTVIVPAGYGGNGNKPFGLSFLGTGYSEPTLIGFAYDYEQASRLRVPPTKVNAGLVPERCGR
jgi:amidase